MKLAKLRTGFKFPRTVRLQPVTKPRWNKAQTSNHSQRQHARLGASDSERWLACPGSVQLIEKFYAAYPDEADDGSYASQEGEFAHEVSEWCIRQNVHPKSYNSFQKCCEHFQPLNEAAYDLSEIASNVAKYLDYVGRVMQRVPNRNYERFLEIRVDFSEWVAGGFGTLDLGFVSADTVYIFDLKYGKGRVAARANSQLQLYALGLWAQLGKTKQAGIHNFCLNICQPRISNFSQCWLDKEELLEFGELARAQSQIALSPAAPLRPGPKQCRWCAAKRICPSYA